MRRIMNWNEYLSNYQLAFEQPEKFWSSIAEDFQWMQKWNRATPESVTSFDNVKWFDGGKLNITQNVLDRYVISQPDKVAIHFEPNNENSHEKRSYTYKELFHEVCRMALTLKKLGVKKGDTVTLYMSMNPNLLISTLACARIGAIHSVVFGGFSANALGERILDAGSSLVITQEDAQRGDKTIVLRKIVEESIESFLSQFKKPVKTLIFNPATPLKNNQLSVSQCWDNFHIKLGDICDAEPMLSEDPLFILYTSGSTGKPKGLLHTTAGYMVWVAYTFTQVFGVEKNSKDIFWCTADIGWITGHSYFTYGPLLSGVTQVMFEGIPTYPDASRWWKIIDDYNVTHFYTAPTAIRSLESLGTKWFDGRSLNSLKVLGSVGEPINAEAWHWYDTNVGKQKCPIVDTWWQTETGGVMISPLANITECIPTMATFALPGVYPALVDDKGKVINEKNATGNLVITRPWPGMARSIWNDSQRYQQTYFSTYPGNYFTGDGANRDNDGRYRITGRVDDVINVSGHRLSTAEIENAINEADEIVESAVVGMPHKIKGQGILAYVLLKPELYEQINEEELKVKSNDFINLKIGPIAKVDKLVVLKQLPKTRSGKIMRRILRKAAEGEWNSFGDTSTLLNPEVVEEIKIKIKKTLE